MTTVVSNIAAPKKSELRERTRRRLLHVARGAFARKGHVGTILKDDILVPARVSVGSFYHQFRDKTDLFLAILREHSETFRGMVREAHRRRELEGPYELARHSYETVFRLAEENEDLFRIMARERESDDSRVRQYLREDHRLWVESLADDYCRLAGADIASDGRAQLAAELVISLTLGALLTYLDQPTLDRHRMRERLISGLVHFTIAGVAGLVGQSAAAPRASDPVAKE